MEIKKEFENIWKLKSINKNYKEEDKKRYYDLFLEGYGCAVIDVEDNKVKWETHTTKPCYSTDFHGIDCLENDEKEYGFEGCYNNDLNHPDLRPGHRIWIKKIHAEKLLKLFKKIK